MYVDLSSLPDAPKEYQICIKDLSGGVNERRVSSEISDNQCAEMVNMLWENGALRSRKGLISVPLSDNSWTAGNCIPIAIFDKIWHGYVFLALADDAEENPIFMLASYNVITMEYSTLYKSSVATGGKQGSFFQFGEKLYYKGRNTYIEITASDDTGDITAADVVAYRPIIQINTSRSGSGDLYQSENRICAEKEIWFNADSGSTLIELPCDGNTKVFDTGYGILQKLSPDPIPEDGVLVSVDELYVGASLFSKVDTLTANGQYKVDYENGRITFFEAPPYGLKVTARVTLSAYTYCLPSGLNGAKIVSVSVAGVEYVEKIAIASEGEYLVVEGLNREKKIVFSENLGTWNDANGNANRIKVVCRLENANAKKAIDDCDIASTYGATGIEANCIVMAGSTAQPNAFFWSGNDQNGANPAYFPMEQYNLVGEANDPISVFGRQQNRLVVFQENRISSAEYAFTEVDDRTYVSLNVRNINDKIGCDLPQTLQLIENNLVWCSSKYGVMYLKDSTYAYETMVVCISGNVEKSLYSSLRHRRLPETRRSSSAFDDGKRYWCCINGTAYVWDYSIRGYTSDTEKLSWFPQKSVSARGWAIDGDKVYGLSSVNRGTETTQNWLFSFSGSEMTKDFGEEPIYFSATLKTMTFGTYAYLKSVHRMVVSMATDERSSAKVFYTTDYDAVRKDLTDIDNDYERNLLDLDVEPPPQAVRVRKPKCQRVHHFTVSFENDGKTGMNLLSVQIFYTYRGGLKSGLRM